MNSATGALRPFAPALNGSVHEVKASGGYLYIAGRFTQVDGVARSRVARFDLDIGRIRPDLEPQALRHRVLDRAGRLHRLPRRHVHIGRRVRATDPRGGQRRRRQARHEFRPALTEGGVRDVQSGHGRLYVAGSFETLGGNEKYGKLGAVNLATGAVDTSFVSNVHVLTREVEVAGDRVYAALDGRGGEIRAFTKSGATLWYQAVDGGMQSVEVWGSAVIGGGHFDRACVNNHAGPLGECVDGVRA